MVEVSRYLEPVKQEPGSKLRKSMVSAKAINSYTVVFFAISNHAEAAYGQKETATSL